MSVKLVEVKSFQELKELNVPQGTKIRYTCSICGKQREQKFINVINKGMLKCGSCLQTEVRRANPNYWDSYKKAKETYKKSYLESERYLNKQKALEEKFNKKLEKERIRKQKEYEALLNNVNMQIKKAHAEFYRSNVVELDYALLNKLPKGQKVCYVCKSCGKTENTTLGQYTNRKYKSDHLCIKCHLSYVNNIPSFKESNLRKSMESSIKKFGVPVPIMSKDVRDAFEASMLDKYGVKNAFLLKTFQEKAEKTQQEKFGTKRWIQSEYAFKRTYGSFLRKYYYNGIYFDSSWELAFYVYFNDKGVPIKRESTRYEYIHKGKVHSYFPDFKLPCCEVEIKGSHLIDKDGKWICPYGNDDGTSEAKHQCAIDNGVIIITSKKIKFFINYVKDKYGNKFFKTYMLHKGIGATDVEK